MARELLSSVGLETDLLRTARVRPQRLVEGVSTVTLQIDAGSVRALAESPGVEYVRAVRVHRMHLDVSTQLLGLGSPTTAEYDGRGVRVAVIDSGIDADHPDLRGRVSLSGSRNFTEEGSVNDVTDTNGHGTHVAVIIGGSGTKYRGVAPAVEFIVCKVFDSTGRAEEGSVMAAVRWAVDNGANVINYSGGYAPVLYHPVSGRVVLVDPPWVWPSDLIEEESEFKRAMDSGIVAVVSAGNEGEIGRRGTLSMPATCPAVISVGSIDKEERLSGFSSVGPAYRSASVSPGDAPQTLGPELQPYRRYSEIDVLAPGGGVDQEAARSGGCYYLPGIISGLARHSTEGPECIVDRRYVRMSGTSQAAPHISGLAALTLQAARELSIDFGPRQAYAVKSIVRAASKRLSAYSTREQGRGLPKWPSIEQILRDIGAGRLSVGRLRT